ncbi:MAG: nucleotidyltransferase family protein [Gemmatimonas sp.]
MTSTSESLRLIVEALQPKAGGLKAALRRRAVDDWTRPLELANTHLLTPSLYAALAASHRLAALPTEVRDYLKLLHRNTGERNAALRAQALDLLRALGDAGVPAMPLKGALSLFCDHFPDHSARLFRDIDVLVPAQSMADAVRALEGLGYAAKVQYTPVLHAYGEFTRDGDPGAVDLHVELIDARYVLPARELWEHASVVERDGVSFHLPSPTDQVMHNLLHAQIHYTGNFYRAVLQLQQVYEFTLLARRHGSAAAGGAIDWAVIETRFARYRLTTALQSYALAAAMLFDLPWPLSAPPSLAARIHVRRCLVQLHMPRLADALLPWGNLRAAFAWHRMQALYADAHPLVPRRLRHAWAFVRKTTGRAMVDRLFRVS